LRGVRQAGKETVNMQNELPLSITISEAFAPDAPFMLQNGDLTKLMETAARAGFSGVSCRYPIPRRWKRTESETTAGAWALPSFRSRPGLPAGKDCPFPRRTNASVGKASLGSTRRPILRGS
jgi:hypothetical protein